MDFGYRIKDAKKEYVQADNIERIHVCIEILNGEDVAEERSFGYPLETTTEQIKTDLETFITTYNADYKRNLANAEQEAREASANETIQALLGQKTV